MKKEKEDPTHELLGEEYACDGEWALVTVMSGTKKKCSESKKHLFGDYQYRGLQVFKIDKDD
tara:strand:- start:275 stop:460 length:186 start_codon:yes stop_codon:yes gene_type:complete